MPQVYVLGLGVVLRPLLRIFFGFALIPFPFTLRAAHLFRQLALRVSRLTTTSRKATDAARMELSTLLQPARLLRCTHASCDSFALLVGVQQPLA